MKPEYCSASGRESQNGLTMIEVLVTMVIIIVGILGLMGLMLRGLQSNATSMLRSVAVAQAYDMADRMRANYAGVQAGNYDTILAPGSTSTCSTLAGSNPLVGPPSGTLGGCSACSSSSCTVANVAARDACVWHQSNAALLPSGSAAVCKDVANNWYTIYVSWDDSKSGTTSKTFALRFEP
jgi:type IV pilus assembly protein PilV